MVAANPTREPVTTYTVTETARLLHVCRNTVYNLLRRGVLRKFPIPIRGIRITRGSVEALLSESRQRRAV